ncbi:MAG TPA: GAF domain-containing protein [Anaeromyxobacteraceae bacterium]|nr:GAF domain-containing protein [Anaeromyxobacteraceae bacterium]
MNPWQLLDSLPVATLWVRGERIAFANRAAEHLIGIPAAQLVGTPSDRFLAPGESRRVRGRLDRRLRGTPEPTLYEVVVQAPDGRVLPLEVHVAPLAQDELLLQFVDVSARAGHLERVEGLARLGARVQRETSRDGVLTAVLDGLAELGLAALLVRSDGREARVARFRAPPAAVAALRSGGLHGDPSGRVMTRAPWPWREGALYVDDAPAAALHISGLPPAAADVVRDARLERAIALRVGDPPDAVVVAAGDWITPADVPAFRLFGAQVTAALASMDALGAAWARNELVEVSATAPGLAEFFARGGQVVQEALGCDGVAVWLLDAERDELLLGHFRGEAPDLLAPFARIPVAASRYFGGLLRGQRAELLQLADLDEPERRAFGRAGFQSFATVPLRIRSRVVGVITVGFRERHEAGEPVVATLRSLAGLFAAAVETQRLVDALRRRVSELELMNATAVASASLDVRTLLGEAVPRMLRTFGADMGGAWVLEGEELVCQALEGVEAAGSRSVLARFPAAQGAAGKALRSGQPVALHRPASRADRDLSLWDHAGVDAVAVVPLVVKQRAIGIVALGWRRPVPFQEVELQLLSAVASQLGVAVEGSRLVEDLTRSYAELGRAQKQLVHRERLAALGELSAVVAHEVRNPLGVIFNSLGSLQRILRPEGDAGLLLDVIQEEADRLDRIVGDLLDFARPAEPAIQAEPIERLLEESVVAALAQVPGPVEVRRSYAPDLPPVPVDAHQVRQAVLNLVVNALQSMPRGGLLEVRTRAEKGFAVVEVADSGPGIPPELRPRVFEPFFTTKATGTGLGLAVVRRIAEGHGGSVELAPDQGSGTTFVLRLPLAPVERGRMDGAASPSAP